MYILSLEWYTGQVLYMVHVHCVHSVPGPLCSDEQPIQAAPVPERGLQVVSHSPQFSFRYSHYRCDVVCVRCVGLCVCVLKTVPADAGCWSLSTRLRGHHWPLWEWKLQSTHSDDSGAAGTSAPVGLLQAIQWAVLLCMICVFKSQTHHYCCFGGIWDKLRHTSYVCNNVEGSNKQRSHTSGQLCARTGQHGSHQLSDLWHAEQDWKLS